MDEPVRPARGKAGNSPGHFWPMTTIGSPRADFIMARSDSAPIYRAAERLIHYHIRLIERV